MHVLSTRVLSTLGADSSRRLFLHLQPGENVNYPSGVTDNTHFSPAGAELMACLAVEGMSEMRLELLSRLARDSARAVSRRLEPTGCRAVALLAR
jgi:DNA sulfur modification protein DndE